MSLNSDRTGSGCSGLDSNDRLDPALPILINLPPRGTGRLIRHAGLKPET